LGSRRSPGSRPAIFRPGRHGGWHWRGCWSAPTAALDAAGEALVARLIDAHLDAGGSVLIATHHDLGLTHKVTTIRLGQAAVAA
jgi:hypothetical protein